MRETTKGCDVLQAGFLWLRIGVPTIRHLYALFLIDIEYEYDWISFTMNYNV